MNIKDIFDKAENGNLTFEQFEAFAKEGNAKFTDLSEGKYVSKSKYEDDLVSKDDAIKQLNDTIAQRDTDLANLQTKLKDAGTDTTKLSELQNSFDSLQNKYTEDMKAYQDKLTAQQYEFAVKEFAGNLEFTSQAAKRDFVREMINESLKMKEDTIIGADDFKKAYEEKNVDAFVSKTEPQTPAPAQSKDADKPQFISSTPGGTAPKQPTLSEMMAAANAKARQ